MAIWKTFEVECTAYLNERFGMYATFIHEGGSDSTVPDILVKAKNGSQFYIDAKHCPAQCGQFVLLPDLTTQTFTYSSLNVTPINPYAEKIIEYMNAAFEEFKEAGTAGRDIIMPNSSEIFANWIIQMYEKKGVKFFITNGYTLVPIEHFNECFSITAKYRVKRSGSSAVGKRNFPKVQEHVQQPEYRVTSAYTSDAKMFVTSDKPLHNTRFILDGTEYMFSVRDDMYEIRKLSNVFNANVIFSIKLRDEYSKMSDSEFTCLLR